MAHLQGTAIPAAAALVAWRPASVTALQDPAENALRSSPRHATFIFHAEGRAGCDRGCAALILCIGRAWRLCAGPEPITQIVSKIMSHAEFDLGRSESEGWKHLDGARHAFAQDKLVNAKPSTRVSVVSRLCCMWMEGAAELLCGCSELPRLGGRLAAGTTLSPDGAGCSSPHITRSLMVFAK